MLFLTATRIAYPQAKRLITRSSAQITLQTQTTVSLIRLSESRHGQKFQLEALFNESGETASGWSSRTGIACLVTTFERKFM